MEPFECRPDQTVPDPPADVPIVEVLHILHILHVETRPADSPSWNSSW